MNATADPLPIRSVEFLGGMASAQGWRPDATLPEVAFWGRSNVGKSSLINCLVRRKKVARVSTTPGRTREINFFSVNGTFVLADLPGYGYARASKTARASWRPLIESYLASSQQLRGVVLLLDVRHDPSEADRGVLDLLGGVGVPVLIVATKTDKLSARGLAARIAALVRALGVEEDVVLPVSSVTGAGRDELAASVMALFDQPPWRNS
ncbi:MAG TPA: ribosome biogenesis GTP-binding protein YihA/YsxC [Gemmatimonadaceae bacterium]|nr:ribosome biogenesis GTP-binding protein YihA/YsxC [Gemmatimonadaceae bacterium]